MSLVKSFCHILCQYIELGIITNYKSSLNTKDLYSFLCTLHDIMNQSDECFVIMAIYFERLISRHKFIVNSCNLIQILFIAGVAAVKMYDDFSYKNSYYAKVSGISQQDMNRLEENFLVMIDYRLMINEESYNKYHDFLSKFI
ncbi:hypothetical protein SteCoe_256 [Stentor coeruleus]|uniref:Cyclin n=1 Tax=Stentor coeruleus TaxID=5963 RepID=A0A1R2D4S4_9CILI|nr:hypothetical protein SteCoe_256 [Stentor coeruleus]